MDLTIQNGDLTHQQMVIYPLEMVENAGISIIENLIEITKSQACGHHDHQLLQFTESMDLSQQSQ